MAQSDTVSVINQFEELIAGGRDAAQFVTDFTWYLRNLLILKKTDENASDLIDMPAEQIREMTEIADLIPENAVIRYIRELSGLMSALRSSQDARIRIEVTLIRLCRPERSGSGSTGVPSGLDTNDLLDRLYQAETAQQQMLERIRTLEKQIAEGAAGTGSAPGKDPVRVRPEPADSIPEEPVYAPPAPEELQLICANWPAITAQVREGFFRQLLAKASPEFDPKEKEPVLYAVFSNGLAERVVEKEELAKEVEWIISRKYKLRVPVRFRMRGNDGGGLAAISVGDRIRSKIHMEIDEEE